jgi:hypothetical protein
VAIARIGFFPRDRRFAMGIDMDLLLLWVRPFGWYPIGPPSSRYGVSGSRLSPLSGTICRTSFKAGLHRSFCLASVGP